MLAMALGMVNSGELFRFRLVTTRFRRSGILATVVGGMCRSIMVRVVSCLVVDPRHLYGMVLVQWVVEAMNSYRLVVVSSRVVSVWPLVIIELTLGVLRTVRFRGRAGLVISRRAWALPVVLSDWVSLGRTWLGLN